MTERVTQVRGIFDVRILADATGFAIQTISNSNCRLQDDATKRQAREAREAREAT